MSALGEIIDNINTRKLYEVIVGFMEVPYRKHAWQEQNCHGPVTILHDSLLLINPNTVS
jgi:hypothetical protein